MIIKQNILHHYKSLLKEEELTKRSKKHSDYAIDALYNIINTMKLSRNNMICGEDFSYLDFGNIPMNNTYWSDGDNSPCTFYGSRFSEWNFISGHAEEITSIAISKDGKTILSGSVDRTAILWDKDTGLMKDQMCEHFNEVMDVCFAPNKDICVAVSRDGYGHWWDFNNKRIKPYVFIHNAPITSVSFSKDENYCLTGSRDCSAIVWDCSGIIPVEYNVLKSKTGYVNSVDFSPIENDICLTGTEDGTITLWNAKEGKVLRNYSEHTCSVKKVAFFSNEDTFLSLDIRGIIKKWHINSSKSIYTKSLSIPFAHSCISISPDGSFFLCNTFDCIDVYNSNTGEKEQKSLYCEECVSSMSISNDGNTVIVGTVKGNILEYDIKLMTERKVCHRNTFYSSMFIISPQHTRAISVAEAAFNEDGAILWDLCRSNIEKIIDKCNYANISNNDESLITCSNYDLSVINLCSEKMMRIKCDFPCGPAVFSKNRDYCAVAVHNSVIIWKIEKENLIKAFEFKELDGEICSVVFDNNNNYCLAGSENGTIVLMKLKEDGKNRKYKESNSPITTIAFSEESQYFFSGSENGEIKKWNIDYTDSLFTFNKHNNAIISINIIKGRNYCVSGSNSDETWMWDSESGIPIRRLLSINEKNQYNSDYYTNDCLSIDCCFPYVIEKCFGYNRIWKYIMSEDYNSETLQYFDTYFNIKSLFVSHCDFRSIHASINVKEILYQNSALVDQSIYNKHFIKSVLFAEHNSLYDDINIDDI